MIHGMKRLVIALTLAAGCSSPPSAPEPQKPTPVREVLLKKVLVLDFKDESGFGNPGLGGLAADHVTASLTASGKYRVIDRTQASKVLEELKGADRDDAGKIGLLLGVDYVVFGTLNMLGMHVESDDSPGGPTKSQVADCRLTIKVLAVGATPLAAALVGKGTARRTTKPPARMSFDPTLTHEAVQNAIEDVKASLLPVLK
jgi:curli biogenesis system outer membrane secretion channel CsgG